MENGIAGLTEGGRDGEAQVLHRFRTKFNVRDGHDLANFLADPRREEFDEHFERLARLEADHGYHPARAPSPPPSSFKCMLACVHEPISII